uniref:Uncharacterized protein n=1 Tax=Ananas comosus var. bracteatus TaxID=296719 RepID=A0A6V7Q272_ANACO|nr:unnamed protein product [Ananas comosus var. bracteatus]
MACIQANIYRPSLGCPVNGQDKRLRRISSTSTPYSLQASCLFLSSLHNSHQSKAYPRLVYNGPQYKRLAPICAFGGKGKSESDNDPFSFESLKKAMGGFKREKSVQDLLREQMREREYGGDGGNRDSSGGGGGGGGGGGVIVTMALVVQKTRVLQECWTNCCKLFWLPLASYLCTST